MKKLVLAVGIVFLGSVCFAKNTGKEYVVTKKGKLECKRIDLGWDKARIIQENGDKSVIPISNITSYNADGKQYDKMEVYKNNRDDNTTAFMELIKKKGNMSLYRYTQYNYDAALPFQTFDTFYVYQDGKMYLELDKNSLPNVFKFFDVQYAIA